MSPLVASAAAVICFDGEFTKTISELSPINPRISSCHGSENYWTADSNMEYSDKTADVQSDLICSMSEITVRLLHSSYCRLRFNHDQEKSGWRWC